MIATATNTTTQLDRVTTLSHRIMEKMTDNTPTSDAMILMIMNGRATRKINQLLDDTLSPTIYNIRDRMAGNEK